MQKPQEGKNMAKLKEMKAIQYTSSVKIKRKKGVIRRKTEARSARALETTARVPRDSFL